MVPNKKIMGKFYNSFKQNTISILCNLHIIIAKKKKKRITHVIKYQKNLHSFSNKESLFNFAFHRKKTNHMYSNLFKYS